MIRSNDSLECRFGLINGLVHSNDCLVDIVPLELEGAKLPLCKVTV